VTQNQPDKRMNNQPSTTWNEEKQMRVDDDAANDLDLHRDSVTESMRGRNQTIASPDEANPEQNSSAQQH
jgi:hypothetical protein